MPNFGTDRRRSPRSNLIVQVDCTGESAACLGVTHDISEGGLLMKTQERLAIGTPIALRFALPIVPQAVTIQASGVVARLEGARGMGIRFVNLTERDREAIRRFTASKQ